MRILMVEDDDAIVAALGDLLRAEGHLTSHAARQDDAVALLQGEHFDLALVDVTLAQGNGFSVCSAARSAAPDMPVIFLTASDDEFSTVAGLDMGATDYIAKPFRARELLARINAAVRQARGGRHRGVLSLGDVTVDPASAQVLKKGDEVELSALEYRLLLLFAQAKGRVVTRDNVRDALWDTGGEYITDNAVSVYVKRLRDKIEDDPTNPRLIVTVRGLGYKAVG